MKTKNILCAVAICFFLSPCMAQKSEASDKKIKVGDMAPDFWGVTPEGTKVALSDFKGKLVYIDFWATWCHFCVEEFPYLKKLERWYHDKDVVFMSVSLDSPKDEDKWKAMVKEKSLGGIQIKTQQGVKTISKKPLRIAWPNALKDYAPYLDLPKFMLVSKEGRILSLDAPRPSTGERIKNLINKNI